jgi:transposase
MGFIADHEEEIRSGNLIVYFEDECHLDWGDLCGYVWGKSEERVEVPIVNERCKQTYYGAVNVETGECLVKPAKAGNSEETIAFIQDLVEQARGRRIALIWDGASYHCSQQLKAYLESVNRGLEERDWRVACLRFAPNDPSQNPIEDIWLQGKRFIREFYHICNSFRAVQVLFELVTHRQTFSFPKLFRYSSFLQMT